MIKEFSLRLLPQEAYDEHTVASYLEREYNQRPTAVELLRRTVDARSRFVFVNLTVRAYFDELPAPRTTRWVDYPDVSQSPHTALVVGAGPGGLFAALRLIELGVKPVILERGKDVRARKTDLAAISRTQEVDPESNYAFGEGGAGAFSDGKLYTRSKKRGDGGKPLRVFVQHGANHTILADGHPHIGTDCLPRVIANMRQTILRSGGEVRFHTRMERLIIHQGRVRGVVATHLPTGEQREWTGPVILATGHSARDVYHTLLAQGAALEAKPIAVGVRLEHPAHLIDCIQYSSPHGRGKWLPAAMYSVKEQVEGRGVYSFCMCPGGVVVPAASGPEQLVVNGMSPSHRGGRWSNSGMVVEMQLQDLPPTLAATDDPLRMMRFQEEMERDAWNQAGHTQHAPAQRMTDFVQGRLGASLAPSSYAPGLLASPLHFWMPQGVTTRLREAFRKWGGIMRGFLTEQATVIGVETRTSSPVRILRDSDTMQHPTLPGLFPCGEGAGYAGGIVSSAVDGERCADALARTLGISIPAPL